MEKSKSLVIALVGASNSGKSTLINAIMGEKVSIVTPKVQTTRTILRAIKTINKTQLIFIDTPGIFEPSSKLEKIILNSAWDGLEQGEQILLILDAKRGIDVNVKKILSHLEETNKKAIVVINKVDLISMEQRISLINEFKEKTYIQTIFAISALHNKGIDDLLNYLEQQAPESTWLYAEDQISDAPQSFFAAEITREKLFLNLSNELPYNLTVDTESWKENKTTITIHQTIYVLKESQKTIILGKKGEMIKKIGTESRHDIEESFSKKVNLFLFVKVRKNWMDKEYLYNSMRLNND